MQGLESELGYVSLEELENLEVNGLKVERDLYFTPTKYKKTKFKLKTLDHRLG